MAQPPFDACVDWREMYRWRAARHRAWAELRIDHRRTDVSEPTAMALGAARAMVGTRFAEVHVQAHADGAWGAVLASVPVRAANFPTVHAIATAPQGGFAAVTSSDVSVFDAECALIYSTPTVQRQPRRLLFDQSLLFVSNIAGVFVIDLRAGRVVENLEITDNYDHSTGSFAVHDYNVLVGFSPRAVHYDMRRPELRVRTLGSRPSEGTNVWLDGRHAIINFMSSSIEVLDWAAGTTLQTVPRRGLTAAMALDDQVLLASTGRDFAAYRMDRGRLREAPVRSVEFGPVGRLPLDAALEGSTLMTLTSDAVRLSTPRVD